MRATVSSVILGLNLLASSSDAFRPVLPTVRVSSSHSVAGGSALLAKPKVFIDGEAGTTGLQVRERLEARDDLEVLSIDADKRKDENERKRLINEADAVILCACALHNQLRPNGLFPFPPSLTNLLHSTGLPDAASEEAASWVEPDNDRTVLIDASTAFRVNDDWVYGFPGTYVRACVRVCSCFANVFGARFFAS